MTEKEKEYWLKAQFERWLYGDEYIGYGAGLPGSLIFFWDQQWIKHRKVKGGESALQRPMIRDFEFLLDHRANQCIKNKTSLLVFKATGIGLSTWMGRFAKYTAFTKPGSNTLLTSSSTNTLTSIFMDKIIEPLIKYDDDIVEKIKDGNKKGQLKVELLNKSKMKCFLKINTKNFLNDTDSISSIDARETSETDQSPYNFAGSGADFAAVDEFAIHKRKKEVAKALVSRMRDANTREMEGLLLLGGALEVNENSKDQTGLGSKDVQELKELIEPETLYANSMETMFIPFWYGYNCHLNNGHSDQLAAEHWWNLQAEKFDKSPDKSLLRNFKMTNPRTLDDVLDNVQSLRWEADIAEKIKLQYSETVKATVPLQQCNIVVVNNKYSFAHGKSTWILEHPKAGSEFYINIDGIQTATKTQSINTKESELSNLALTVIRMVDATAHPYMPVCIYSERPESVEVGCYRIIDIIRYYNQHGGVKGVNFEINNGFGEFMISVMFRENLGKLIVKRKDVSSAGYSENSKLGYYRDKLCVDFQYKQANMFLRRYMASIQMLPLLQDMMKPEGVNADILDSWLGIFNSVPDIGMYREKKIRQAIPREVGRFQMINGKQEFVFQKAGDSQLMNQFNNPLLKN